MSCEPIPELDRDLARYLMRGSDAIDLIMGGRIEALRGRTASDPMVQALFTAVNDIHVAIRKPVLRLYPEWDLDETS